MSAPIRSVVTVFETRVDDHVAIQIFAPSLDHAEAIRVLKAGLESLEGEDA